MSDHEEVPHESVKMVETGGKVKLPEYLQKAEKNAPSSKPAWMRKLSASQHGTPTSDVQLTSKPQNGNDGAGTQSKFVTSVIESNASEETAPPSTKPAWMIKLSSSRHEKKSENELLNRITASSSHSFADDDDEEEEEQKSMTQSHANSNRSPRSGSLSSSLQRLRQLRAMEKSDDGVVATKDLIKKLDHPDSPEAEPVADSHKRIMDISNSEPGDLQFYDGSSDGDDEDYEFASEEDTDDEEPELKVATPPPRSKVSLASNQASLASNQAVLGVNGVPRTNSPPVVQLSPLPASPRQSSFVSIPPESPRDEGVTPYSSGENSFVSAPPESPRAASPDESSFAPPKPAALLRSETKQDPVGQAEPVPVFTPVSPDNFAPPSSTSIAPSYSKEEEKPEPRRPKYSYPPPPSKRQVVNRELPAPPSFRDLNQKIDDEIWMVPHREEDDSSWVDPYHPVKKERKQHLSDELKKKSVDLFPEDGRATREMEKLQAINEEAKLLDLKYDARVGLIVGSHHQQGDGQTVSETSFSETSKMDATAQVMESAVPDKNMDVWALPSQQGTTFRSAGAMSEHKDGKDYRFSYIAQQHTHSTSSYADVVRERYFPKEDNEYWAAPTKQETPELPIHISKDGKVKNGPSDENEDWMPPEIDPSEVAAVDKSKYYAPSIAEERHYETKSVVTDGSDWMGQGVGSRSARVDFTGVVNNSDDSDNSFEWNPVKLPSDASEGSDEEESSRPPSPPPKPLTRRAPPLSPTRSMNRGLPRPPSPPTTSRDRAVLQSEPLNSDPEQAISKGQYDYSPSGRLKFDMTPQTILIGDEDRGVKREAASQKRLVYILTCCFFVILVPAAVALVIVFVVDPNDKRGDAPSVVPTVPAPTMVPVISPTMQPIVAPSPPTVDEDALIAFLSSISTDNGAALQDPSTPQYAAMKWLQTPVNESIFDQQVVAQRYALATLYYSTNGDDWTASNGWLSSDPECSWESSNSILATCDLNGFYLTLHLSGNNLAGSIPPELTLLSNLSESRRHMMYETVGDPTC